MADDIYLEKKLISIRSDMFLPARLQDGLGTLFKASVSAQLAFPRDIALLSIRDVYPHPINPIFAEKTFPSTAQVFRCDVVLFPGHLWEGLGHFKAEHPSRVVAKIYDPLFYPNIAQEGNVRAEAEYSAEASAYSALQLHYKSLLGDCVPSFYGAWTTAMTHPETGEERTVWLLLLEEVQGETIGNIIRGRVDRYNSPLRRYFTSLQRERFRLDIMGKALDALAKIQSAGVIRGPEISVDKIMVRLVNDKVGHIDREALHVVLFGFSKATFRKRLPPSVVNGTSDARVESTRLQWMVQFKPWFPGQWTSNSPDANEEAFSKWLSTVSPRPQASKESNRANMMRLIENAFRKSEDAQRPETQEGEDDGIFTDAEFVEGSEADSEELTEWHIIGEDD